MQNVGQKLSRSRNTFSETRVAALENNKIVQPPGKQLWKGKDKESCNKVISSTLHIVFHQKSMDWCNNRKNCSQCIMEYLKVTSDKYRRVNYTENHI